MRKRVTLLLAALSLGFAPAPLPTSKADLKKLQGVWVLTSEAVDGVFVKEFRREIRITIAGDRLVEDETGEAVYVVTLDARKTPRAIDLKVVEGVNVGCVFRGVYRLERDTLTVCYGYPADSVRPEDLDTGPGRLLHVWKRVKH